MRFYHFLLSSIFHSLTCISFSLILLILPSFPSSHTLLLTIYKLLAAGQHRVGQKLQGAPGVRLGKHTQVG